MCPSVVPSLVMQDICVKCLKPGGDNLIHISTFSKQLASHMLLKGIKGMEITGSHAANQN